MNTGDVTTPRIGMDAGKAGADNLSNASFTSEWTGEKFGGINFGGFVDQLIDALDSGRISAWLSWRARKTGCVKK